MTAGWRSTVPRPVAEFQDLSSHIFVREYNGTGDIYSSASWSRAEINGQGYSRIVGGPSGVWLMYQKTFSGPLFLQRIVNGQPLGRAQPDHAQQRLPATPTTTSPRMRQAASRSGGLLLRRERRGAVRRHSSTDGRHWSAPQIIARNLQSPSDIQLGAAQGRRRLRGFPRESPAAFKAAPRSPSPRSARSPPPPRQGPGQPRRRWHRRSGRGPTRLRVLHESTSGTSTRSPRRAASCATPPIPTSGAASSRRDPPQRPGDHPRRRGADRDRSAPAHDQHHRLGPRRAARPRDRRHHPVPRVAHISLSGSLADAGHTLFDFDTATASRSRASHSTPASMSRSSTTRLSSRCR